MKVIIIGKDKRKHILHNVTDIKRYNHLKEIVIYEGIINYSIKEDWIKEFRIIYE